MKIAFFSEVGSGIGSWYPREFSNMRIDCAWAVALKSPVISLDCDLRFNSQFRPRNDGTDFDLGIIIVPKNNPEKAFRCFETNKQFCQQWSTMQEAQNSFWQNFSIENQINYLNFLSELDHILVHNEIDRKYFKGLIPHKTVSVMQSLMIEDAIPVEAKKVPLKRSSCIIGGTWSEWYSGQDSFMIAQEFGEKIFAPSMGRKQSQESNLEGIEYLPYMNWSEWMQILNHFKYAVHLMRTYAAGSFQLNCARLSIPCISWNSLDTQMICHPELSFNEGDMVSARKAAKNLRENEQFYNHCAASAFKNYQDNFTEGIFLQRFYENFNSK